MITLEMLLKKGEKVLQEAGVGDARLDAWLLLEYLTGKNRAYYYAHPEEAAAEELALKYDSLIKERARHIPLQHITHQAFFMGYEFYVDEHVLIPRQDTETLVEEALKILEGAAAPRILDMCTGSGCILLSLLAKRPDASGTGADIMPEALRTAKKNEERLLKGNRVQWIESDLFSAEFFQKNGEDDRQEYDMLISNPPYIPEGEIDGLMEEVRLYDPRTALDGGRDGLKFYRQITVRAPGFLKRGGWLLCEIGCGQGEAVAALFEKNGFQNVAVKQDLAGLDRVVLGQKQEGRHV